MAFLSPSVELAGGSETAAARLASAIVATAHGHAMLMLDELPRVFRTGNPVTIYAAACISSSSSMTSCGVLYPSVE
jgi:hypothetical protein